jgi:hypothetical protein
LSVLVRQGSRLVHTAGEDIGHNVPALAVSEKDNLAARAAGVDVGLNLGNGVLDAVGDGVGVVGERCRVVDGDADGVGHARLDQGRDLAGLAFSWGLVGASSDDDVQP